MDLARKLLRFARLVRDLVRLAPGWRASIGMARAALVLWPLRRLRRSEGPVRVTARCHGQDLVLFLGQADDLGTLREIFLDETYRPPAGPELRTVVDLGANIGLASRYFATLAPGARILAVEPDPRAVALLRTNVRGMKRVAVEPVAVTAGRDETVDLFLGAQTIASSVLGPREGGQAERVTVRARTLDDLLHDHGIDTIDLLKVDVEGMEFDILRSTGALGRVRAIAGEFHRRDGGPTAEEFFALLDGFALDVTDEGDHQTFVGVREALPQGVTPTSA